LFKDICFHLWCSSNQSILLIKNNYQQKILALLTGFVLKSFSFIDKTATTMPVWMVKMGTNGDKLRED
jgi:hypothetical protein